MTLTGLLLRRGARVDAGFHTALHAAAQRGHLEVVKLLLAKKANPNARCPSCRATPLKLATQNHREAVAELLRKHGAAN